MTIFAQRNMTDKKPAGWRMWKLFAGAVHRHERDARLGTKAVSVRLIEGACRAPESLIEVQVLSVLKKEGSVSYDRMVQRVANELYEAELRRGAAAIDIGIFGSRLFEREVVGTLKAADGVLWKITSGEGKV